MRLLKFAIALLLTGGLTWLLSNPLQFGEKRFPALGHLFNPFTGFWQNADPVPQGEEDLFRLPGLTAPAEVVYDERLVPHIFAENLRDALAVQGFIVAQHRLWQMDIMARRAAGRLSEVLGPATLEIDRRQRRMGLPYAAEQTLATWQESTLGMELLEAYSDGVNAYLRQLSPKDYPLEYKLMGYGPEAWSPLKTALVMKVMAATLCAREDDLEATNSLEQLGREAVHPVLMLDEAHLLRQHVLDHRHVLCNYQWDQKPLLSLILVGLPELWDSLSLRKNRSLWSRIHHRVAIGPPGLGDTNEYVDFRLKRAGAKTMPFTSDALSTLHEATAGQLRDVDRVATKALRAASRRKMSKVDVELLVRVLEADQRAEGRS